MLGIADQLRHRADWAALLGGLVAGIGGCLYIQRVWDFVQLKPYDPVRTPPADQVIGPSLLIMFGLMAMLTLIGSQLGPDGRLRIAQSGSLATGIILWFMIIQVWRHR